jgi:peroxiredoxin
MKIGDTIEDFEAEAFMDGDIKKVKFSDYKGKWVVMLFYPADFTFVCPTELSEMADHYDEVKGLGGEVLSVSVDTAFVHKAWHDESPSIKKVKYPMVADPTRKICTQFGTLDENEGLSVRGTFIISPEGVLKAMDLHDNSIGRSSREILRKLKAAKFVSEHDGFVCPASWEPGKDTLKPGTDLIGKL